MSADLSKVEDLDDAEDYPPIEIRRYAEHPQRCPSIGDLFFEPMSEVEYSPKFKDLSEINKPSTIEDCYPDGPADFSHIKISVWYGSSETRLFWNLEDYPFSPSADLESINRCLELALHRMGVHGSLQLFAHGGTEDLSDFYVAGKACMLHTPKEGQISVAAQMCVDMFRFVKTFSGGTVFVVIARQEPETVLNRFLERLQSNYHKTVLIVEPPADPAQDDLFKSADSVFERTHFVGGGKTIPPDCVYKFITPVQEIETGVFWDLEDCPFPPGWSLDKIYMTIRSAFTSQHGVSDNMSVYAYVDEKKSSSWGGSVTTGESRIQLYPGGDDKAARHERMLVDVLLWLVDHPHLAHLIIGGQFNEKVFDILARLEERHTIFLAIAIPKKGTFGIEEVHTFGWGAGTETESPHPKRLKAGEGSEDEG